MPKKSQPIRLKMKTPDGSKVAVTYRDERDLRGHITRAAGATILSSPNFLWQTRIGATMTKKEAVKKLLRRR